MGANGTENRGVGADRHRLRFRWLADIKSGRGLQPLRDDHKPLIDFREQREEFAEQSGDSQSTSDVTKDE